MPFCSSSRVVLRARQSPGRSWSRRREDAALCGDRIFTSCASPAALPAHHFNYPGKLLPEFHPGTVSPLLFSGTYKNKIFSCSSCALVPSSITPRAAPTSLSQIKNKNNYVGMSNSSLFKSTLGRLTLIFKLAAEQRLKFEPKDWLHH